MGSRLRCFGQHGVGLVIRPEVHHCQASSEQVSRSRLGHVVLCRLRCSSFLLKDYTSFILYLQQTSISTIAWLDNANGGDVQAAKPIQTEKINPQLSMPKAAKYPTSLCDHSN
jgi:hypothetical protein